MTEDMTIIAEEAYLAAKEILEKARLEQGELFVVGCSTSEVGGATIGTYSSPELAEMVSPQLTTVEQPSRDIGRTAVTLLLKKIDNPDATAERVMMDWRIIARASA